MINKLNFELIGPSLWITFCDSGNRFLRQLLHQVDMYACVERKDTKIMF